MDSRMDGGENGRSARVLNGPQTELTLGSRIFSDGEWSQLIVDLRLPLRQAQIVRLLFAGASDKDVAAELDISVPTVRTHIGRLFWRFGVKDRTELVLYVFRQFRRNSGAIGHRL